MRPPRHDAGDGAPERSAVRFGLDGPVKPGHDEKENHFPAVGKRLKTPDAFGSGAYVVALRPRIMSDALSAIIRVEALRLAEIIRGMIEASITRKFCRPWTRS